eukprot:2332574-Alexandrium_andersonii.AAC.1
MAPLSPGDVQACKGHDVLNELTAGGGGRPPPRPLAGKQRPRSAKMRTKLCWRHCCSEGGGG